MKHFSLLKEEENSHLFSCPFVLIFVTKHGFRNELVPNAEAKKWEERYMRVVLQFGAKDAKKGERIRLCDGRDDSFHSGSANAWD